MSLTLDSVKEYLRIDSDAEDDLLERFMTTAEAYLHGGITNYKANLSDPEFSDLADIVKLSLITEMYENRSPGSGLTDFSFTVRSIISQMQFWGGSS